MRRHIELEMGALQSSVLLPSHARAVDPGSAGRLGASKSFDPRRYLGFVEVATRPRRQAGTAFQTISCKPLRRYRCRMDIGAAVNK